LPGKAHRRTAGRDLEAIPVALDDLAARERRKGFERLARARRLLAEYADPYRTESLELDDVHAALDARCDAYAVVGEWTAEWRTR
jgi:hypothetical protein